MLYHLTKYCFTRVEILHYKDSQCRVKSPEYLNTEEFLLLQNAIEIYQQKRYSLHRMAPSEGYIIYHIIGVSLLLSM